MALNHMKICAALLLIRKMQIIIPEIQFLTYQIGKDPDVGETPLEIVRTRNPRNGGPCNVAGGIPGAFLLSVGAFHFFHWSPLGLKSLPAQGTGWGGGVQIGFRCERAQLGEEGTIQDTLYLETWAPVVSQCIKMLSGPNSTSAYSVTSLCQALF